MNNPGYKVVSMEVFSVSLTKTPGDNVSIDSNGQWHTRHNYVNRSVFYKKSPVVIRYHNFILNRKDKTFGISEEVPRS